MKFEKNGKRITEYSNYTHDINAIWDGLAKQANPKRRRLTKKQARMGEVNEI